MIPRRLLYSSVIASRKIRLACRHCREMSAEIFRWGGEPIEVESDDSRNHRNIRGILAIAGSLQ
jgi:hypothetical protein